MKKETVIHIERSGPEPRYSNIPQQIMRPHQEIRVILIEETADLKPTEEEPELNEEAISKLCDDLIEAKKKPLSAAQIIDKCTRRIDESKNIRQSSEYRNKSSCER